MVVLGQRDTKDTHVSSIQLAAALDVGGHVVADHGVHVCCRVHRGETVLEQPVLRAFANNLCGGSQDRCSRGGGRFACVFYLLLDRCNAHHSGNRLA